MLPDPVTNTQASAIAQEGIAGLRENGFHIARNIVAAELIERLNHDLDPVFELTPPSEGLFYGNWTRRFGGLLKRSAITHALTMNPDLLRVAEEFLLPNCDRLQLSLMQAIELAPGGPAQVPHRDDDSWGGEKGKMEYMVSVMWPLTPFNAQTGATRVWPKSHGNVERMAFDPDGSIPSTMNPGDALVFLGSTMHASGGNFSNLPRRGLIISYCLGWLKPHENQWLAYPPNVAKHFSPELAALAGYQRHRPNLNNYEGQCPSILLKDAVPDFIPAADEFPDALNQMILAYRAAEQALRHAAE
jgi:Phytanoyl-CoA dioxygenase (PhyH)